MATKKTTTNKKTGPGRPRKNVIWWKKTTRWPGRPRKNVILTKEERLQRDANQKKQNKKKINTTKTPKKKTTTPKSTPKKPTNKKQISKKTNKITSKKTSTTKTPKKTKAKNSNNKTKKASSPKPKTNSKKFTHHRITKQKLQNNFALYLLIASFLLFSFSVYKTFFENNSAQKPQDTIQEETKLNPPSISIESYEDIMGSPQNQSWKTQSEQVEHQLPTNPNTNTWNKTPTTNPKTTPIMIPTHTFIRAFDKDEHNDEIAILQKFLYSHHLYTGEFNAINDAQTREAVYKFQLEYKILTPQDPINLHWYFWPSTRSKINIMMPH